MYVRSFPVISSLKLNVVVVPLRSGPGGMSLEYSVADSGSES